MDDGFYDDGSSDGSFSDDGSGNIDETGDGGMMDGTEGSVYDIVSPDADGNTEENSDSNNGIVTYPADGDGEVVQ